MEENKDTSIEKQWRCRQCGYTYFGTERQYECPQCGWIEAHYDYKQAYFDMVDKYKRDILSISLNERDKTLQEFKEVKEAIRKKNEEKKKEEVKLEKIKDVKLEETKTKTTKWYEFVPDDKFLNFLAWSAAVLIGEVCFFSVVALIFCVIDHL